jgi:GT2 family glycosyltransferase
VKSSCELGATIGKVADMREIISVVIATRDRPEQLLACLRSLHRSAPPPGWAVEVIVVDNGGYDRAIKASVLRLAGDTFAVTFLGEARRGKAVAVNTGTAAARGSIVAFLDDDVTVGEDWTTAVVDEFRRDPELGLLAGRVLNADPAQRGVAVSLRDEAFELAATDRLEGLAAGCNLAVRRHVIAAVRGRDTRLGPGTGLAYEDIDFIRRVLRSGFRGRFSPRPVAFHRPGPRNRGVEYPRGRGAYYVKFILKGDPTVARHAWWELNNLWRAFARGSSPDRTIALRTGWHLAIGAATMCGRLLRRSS